MNGNPAGKKFVISGAIQYGWQAFRENAGILIGSMIIGYGIIMGFQLFLGYIEGFAPQDPAATELYGEPAAVWWIQWPLIILGAIVSWLIGIGIMNIQLKIYHKQQTSLKDLFQHWELLPHVILGSILTTIITGAGFIALIIPGIYLSVRLSQVNYFVVDQKMDGVSAIKASFAATKKQFWSLLGLFLTLAIINILGALALLIGLIVTIPMSMMALVYVYNALGKQDSSEQVSGQPRQPVAL